jgi:hypothetical protein
MARVAGAEALVMAVQAASAHSSRPASLEHPPGDSGAKKNENDFDSAFDLAMFAIPPSIAMPSGNAILGSRNATDASPAESAEGTGGTGSKSEPESRDGGAIPGEAAAPNVSSLENSSPALAGSSEFLDSSAAQKSISSRASGGSLADSAFAATIEIVYHAQSQLGDGNAAASAVKPAHSASQPAIGADTASHPGAADAIAVAVPAEQAQATSNHATEPNTSASHSKPSSARSNPASGDRSAAEATSAGSSAGGASINLQPPTAQALSALTIESAVQEAADDSGHSGVIPDEKHNAGAKIAPDATLGPNADGTVTASMLSAPAITGTGSSQPAASVAPTLRVRPEPAVEARIASLTIDLASGQSTHATIREHAGAVDVRIVAASQQSANAISSELPALRRALDAAGMHLKAADVTHHGEREGSQHGNRQDNPSARRDSADSTTFALGEVN